MPKNDYHGWQKDYRKRRTAERYVRAVDYLGGKCVRCGMVDVLQFDHVDPGTKSYDISLHLWDYSWERLLLELAKCQLLCIPCHKAKTVECGETGGGHNKIAGDRYHHGTPRMYLYKKCRCDPCTKSAMDYKRKLVDIEGNTPP